MTRYISIIASLSALLVAAPLFAQDDPDRQPPRPSERPLTKDERQALRKHMKHRQIAQELERKSMKHRILAHEYGREFRHERFGPPSGSGPQGGPPPMEMRRKFRRDGFGPEMGFGPHMGPDRPIGPGPQADMPRHFRHQQFGPQMAPEHPQTPQHLRRLHGRHGPRAM